MQIRDEGQIEVGVVLQGRIAVAEDGQKSLPVLKRVVVLPDQETNKAKL